MSPGDYTHQAAKCNQRSECRLSSIPHLELWISNWATFTTFTRTQIDSKHPACGRGCYQRALWVTGIMSKDDPRAFKAKMQIGYAEVVMQWHVDYTEQGSVTGQQLFNLNISTISKPISMPFHRWTTMTTSSPNTDFGIAVI